MRDTQKAVHLTMACAQGLVRNSYADETQNVVEGGELFEK